MTFLTKIEVADDAGDTFTEITIPIPFYIRVHLEKQESVLTRYRVRLIDDDGKIRGQYIGATDREYLELHVPLIKLAKPGSLRIFVEESSEAGEYEQSHHISLKYLEYTEEDRKRKPVENHAEISLREDKTETTIERSKETGNLPKTKDSKFNLSDDEAEYLFKREKILGENPIKLPEEE